MDSRRRKVELLHLNVQVRVLLLLVFQEKWTLKKEDLPFRTEEEQM